MSEKKIEKTEIVETPDTSVTAPRWYKNPKNVALAVTSTIAGTAVVIWVKNRLAEDEEYEGVSVDFTSDSDS